MDKYQEFKQSLAKAVEKFNSFDPKQTIRVISHLDADGTSACAILIHLLNKENRKYSISIVPQLTREKIMEFSKEEYPYYIFADLGSGQLSIIAEVLKDKKILILDHHEPEQTEIKENITHINPHLFKIDGSVEISGAGVVYLFAQSISKDYEKLAHLAIIGAIGDVQETKGELKQLNNEILQTAIKKGLLEVKKGIRLFGMQTKPLHKVLEYSTDPYIPGVTGSESGAIQFLHQIGIDPKNSEKNGWKKIIHLSEEDMRKLATGIIMKRLNETSPEDIFGLIYILPNEKQESPTRDVKEFATLLNACGRLGKASFGMGACLGIEKDKKRALETLAEYKKEIINAIKWFEANEKSQKIIKKDKFMIINTEDNIPVTMVGTLASILSKSNNFQNSTYIMTLGQALDNTTKISLRLSGRKDESKDLRDLLKQIIARTGGEAGGHQYAAGCIIPTEKEEEFLRVAEEILTKRTMEEKIN
ncbi:DHH family phosphoesterase [Candidatus Woesearchaeota archaeon]|nr:DHH family phosphoesterase [Candidatus Woesearchaeota archaeon]